MNDEDFKERKRIIPFGKRQTQKDIYKKISVKSIENVSRPIIIKKSPSNMDQPATSSNAVDYNSSDYNSSKVQENFTATEEKAECKYNK